MAELTIVVDEERQPFCSDVPIGARELVYGDGHDVMVRYP